MSTTLEWNTRTRLTCAIETRAAAPHHTMLGVRGACVCAGTRPRSAPGELQKPGADYNTDALRAPRMALRRATRPVRQEAPDAGAHRAARAGLTPTAAGGPGGAGPLHGHLGVRPSRCHHAPLGAQVGARRGRRQAAEAERPRPEGRHHNAAQQPEILKKERQGSTKPRCNACIHSAGAMGYYAYNSFAYYD